MAMAVGGGGGGTRCDINVTPLIDVLLVLLIIFMVITPLTPYGLEATAPQPPPPNAPPPPPNQDQTVVIQIAKDGTMKINQEDIDVRNLEARLVDIFKTRAQRIVFIKGDPDLDFDAVAKAIDIAKGAAIDKIGIMTPKIEQGL